MSINNKANQHLVHFVSYSCVCLCCRAAPVRQELPAAVDQLPPGGREEGEHLQGGRGCHHQAPRHPWEQVTPQSKLLRRPAESECTPDRPDYKVHYSVGPFICKITATYDVCQTTQQKSTVLYVK